MCRTLLRYFSYTMCVYQYLSSNTCIARVAMEKGRSPVIIDNTNTNAWEMKPYVLLVSYIANFVCACLAVYV